MKRIEYLFLLIIFSIAAPSLSQEVASQVIENGGTGKHSAIIMTDTSLPTHTIFRPKKIDKFRGKRVYFKKIDTKKIAIAGMSCGGLQALEIATDPGISTLLVANSGIFIDPIRGNAMPMMPQLDKTHLTKIHTPTLYSLGGPSDIAYKNGMDDVEKINHASVLVGNFHIGHGGTYGQPFGGEFAKVVTAWFKWQLKGDKKAGNYLLATHQDFPNYRVEFR